MLQAYSSPSSNSHTVKSNLGTQVPPTESKSTIPSQGIQANFELRMSFFTGKIVLGILRHVFGVRYAVYVLVTGKFEMCFETLHSGLRNSKNTFSMPKMQTFLQKMHKTNESAVHNRFKFGRKDKNVSDKI